MLVTKKHEQYSFSQNLSAQILPKDLVKVVVGGRNSLSNINNEIDGGRGGPKGDQIGSGPK